MTYITVNLKVIKKNQESIYIPKFLLQKLELKEKEVLPLYFGLHHYKMVKVYSLPSNKKIIYITSKLKEQLLLPYSKNIILQKMDNGLRLGPLIGILTTDLTGNKFSNPVTREKHPFSLFFKGLLAPEPFYPAYYFVFTPNHVNWQSKTIKGYFYKANTKQKSWELISIPFPDVVYNRIPNRTIENKESIAYFKQEYLVQGGKLFNSNFFNKWDMHKILEENEQIKQFIPDTYINPSLTIFEEMLEKHPIVYLKPSNGSLGLGVYRIERRSNDYLVHYRHGNQNKTLTFKKIKSIYQYIFTRKKTLRYLLQQGIDLIDYQQNPVDFRVHLNKNIANEWQVVALGAKVAGKGSVTTHLRTGGKLIDAQQFLEAKYNKQAISMQNAIYTASIQIAKTVENYLGQPLGELGLDIGIDKNNQIWLFEVNSKPGRSIFKHPSLKAASMESSKRLLEYSIYLANNQSKTLEGL